MTTKNPSLPYLSKIQNPTFSEKQKEENMFYSQCILSSKGPLGSIWIAGYFFKRLKKRQINDTDISSSVDKIVIEGLPSVTYRILAYLLLGVVRIYSKKVDYLFQDCHDALLEINKFSVGKKVVPFSNIIRSTPSITLPKKYELDSFILEVVESSSRGNIAQNEDISLKVDVGKDVFSQYSLDKQQFEEISTLDEDQIDPNTSHGEIMEQETCSFAQTPDKVPAQQENFISHHTPPEKVLSPHHIDVETSARGQMKNLKSSRERLRELRFMGDDDMDIDRFCELDVELINLINDYQVQINDDFDRDVVKKVPLENEEFVIVNEKEGLSLTEKTHLPEVGDNGVGNTPELMVVPTPVKEENNSSKKENALRLGKRKCIFDDTTVLSNEIMKNNLKDASGLICKKRRAPCNVLDLWRFHYFPTFPKNFSAPLIPCVVFDLEYIPCGNKAGKTVLTTQLTVQIIEPNLSHTKQTDVPTPSAHADSRLIIAPGTPIRCPTSARVFGSGRVGDSDGEGAYSYENLRKEISTLEEDSVGLSLTTEMDANEADSRELQKNKKGGLSSRTRTMARYLRRVIQSKKQQGLEATLLPIIEQKTKKENAMFFFELLVLSSRGLINVVQEKAYGDVVLQETPQLEATLNKC